MSLDKSTQLKIKHKKSHMCICGRFDCLDECLVCLSVYLCFPDRHVFWDALRFCGGLGILKVV